MGAAVLSFAAGALSVLSPCVLPLLPIVIASALQQHRHGPLALAAGLLLTSTATGLFFAGLGFAVGIDRATARTLAALLMVAAGIVLLLPRLQVALAGLAAPMSAGADALIGRLPAGLGGQFAVGALLGVVWTPCTGPTLAAAVVLAGRSENLLQAGAIMLVFGLGAMVPVLALAYGSRHALRGRRARLADLGAVGKPLIAGLLLAVGALALSGTDKVIEAWMVEHMPQWLLDLTTRL